MKGIVLFLLASFHFGACADIGNGKIPLSKPDIEPPPNVYKYYHVLPEGKTKPMKNVENDNGAIAYLKKREIKEATVKRIHEEAKLIGLDDVKYKINEDSFTDKHVITKLEPSEALNELRESQKTQNFEKRRKQTAAKVQDKQTAKENIKKAGEQELEKLPRSDYKFEHKKSEVTTINFKNVAGEKIEWKEGSKFENHKTHLIETADTSKHFTFSALKAVDALTFERKDDGYHVYSSQEKVDLEVRLYSKENPGNEIEFELHLESYKDPETQQSTFRKHGSEDLAIFTENTSILPLEENPCPKRKRRDVTGGAKTRRSVCKLRRVLRAKKSTTKKMNRIAAKKYGLKQIEMLNIKTRSLNPSRSSNSFSTTSAPHQKSKPSRMSKALSTLEALTEGKLFGKLASGLIPWKGIRMGAFALKAANYERLAKLNAAGKSFTKGVSKLASRANYAFLLRDLANAIRHGDGTSLAIMGGMMGVGVTSQVLNMVGTSAKFASKSLVIAGKVLGAGLEVVGVVFDVVSVVNSHKCVTNHKSNKQLCLRGGNGCVEEYSVCGGRDAIIGIATSYAQLGLGLTSIAVSIAFPPAAPFMALFNLIFGLTMELYQVIKQVDSFAKYLPLTAAERAEQINRVFWGDGIDNKFLTLREQSKFNAKVLEKMGEFLEKNRDAFWAYLGPAYEVIQRTRTVRNEENCRKKKEGCSIWLQIFSK